MKKNLILTGEPNVGKSTLLLKIIEKIETFTARAGICHSILTREIRSGETRVGFKMYENIIAHVDSKSDVRVSRYGVNIEAINYIVSTDELLRGKDVARILCLDEIGEMQLKSELFKKLAKKYLDSRNVCVATLSDVYHSKFTDAIRKRDDIEIIKVTKENREELAETLPTLINEYFTEEILIKIKGYKWLKD